MELRLFPPFCARYVFASIVRVAEGYAPTHCPHANNYTTLRMRGTYFLSLKSPEPGDGGVKLTQAPLSRVVCEMLRENAVKLKRK